MIVPKYDIKSFKYKLLEKRYNFFFIDLKNIVSNEEFKNSKAVQQARESAEESDKGSLTSLKSTESNFRWTLLYDHARLAQIRPFVLHRMRRGDLEFLAGMSLPHPELSAPKGKRESKASMNNRYEQQTKLQGNAVRAQGVLMFRNVLWAGLLAAAATLGGVLLTKHLK